MGERGLTIAQLAFVGVGFGFLGYVLGTVTADQSAFHAALERPAAASAHVWAPALQIESQAIRIDDLGWIEGEVVIKNYGRHTDRGTLRCNAYSDARESLIVGVAEAPIYDLEPGQAVQVSPIDKPASRPHHVTCTLHTD